MKALDINKVIDAKPKAIFTAKVDGATQLIEVTGWTLKGVRAVVVKCEAGANWNFDVARSEETEVPYRNVLAVAFDSAMDFRQDAMAKNDAHFNAIRNY